MVIEKNNKRLIVITSTVISLLLIPLIAMNFTNEVNWGFFDFIVAGMLLFLTGISLELILRNIKAKRLKVVFIGTLFFLLLITWAELAVGVFD